MFFHFAAIVGTINAICRTRRCAAVVLAGAHPNGQRIFRIERDGALWKMKPSLVEHRASRWRPLLMVFQTPPDADATK